MATEINNFRLKIRNTSSLKRKELSFGINEAQALNREIVALEAHIEKLELELKKSKIGFTVHVRNTLMQGKQCEADICRALTELEKIKNLDATKPSHVD